MRIGLDIDDTICNTFDLVLPCICEHFNLNYEKDKKKRINYRDFDFEGFKEYALKNYNDIIPNSPLKKGVIIRYLTVQFRAGIPQRLYLANLYLKHQHQLLLMQIYKTR